MARPSHTPTATGFDDTLVQRLLARALALPAQVHVFGISGLQGSGKSTLARQLVSAARQQGIKALALSLDDFYLGRRERRELSRRVHPLLARRGPPGTHDVALACRTLDALRGMQSGETVRVPRFDKLADTGLPPSRWTSVREPPGLIVFEGWFLGVRPQPTQALVKPVNPMEREQDPDGIWRRWCNRALDDYASLWQRLDGLTWLKAPDFEIVRDWRWQQECTLQRAQPRRQAMDRAQVEDFVLAFERISRHAQDTLAGIADEVIELDSRRRPR
ncbi:MAG: kinase [Gammaproteobacteria bacterium RIFCSPHIGHO2_12_FULL_63_22]|nr:MAG: kinase [Gammaproteobacteria bacterium RIFCSPHIGHO2_12_FULL_63_22]